MMNSKLKEQFLKKYDAIHSYKSFDRSCLEGSMVSDLFTESFVSGPEFLFESLRKYQPLTYSALVSCNDMWLLERKRIGQDGSSFILAIVFDNQLITAQMINKRLINRRNKTGNVIPFSMTALNKELHGYYYCFDGLNNPKTRSPAGLKNYDLPGSLGSWDYIVDFCMENNIKTEVFKEIIKTVSNRLLVWISNDNGEIFLIEEGGDSIYRMNYKRSSDFIKLKKPVDEVDLYCSDVILNRK